MTQPDTYTRFYHRFMEEYPTIYDDKLSFGWWLSLLVIADGAHPSPGYLPAGIPRKIVDKLVAAELITLGTGYRFRIRGVTQERERRSESARVGGVASGRSRSRSTDVEQSFNGRSTDAEPKGNLTEPSRAEPRKTEPSNGLAPLDENDLQALRDTISATPAGPLKDSYTRTLKEREARVH